MHQNRYLLALCTLIIAIMILHKYQDVGSITSEGTGEASAQLSLEKKATPGAEQYAGDDIDASILIEESADLGAFPALLKQKPAAAAQALPKPYITAEAYLVGDLETGKIYAERNSDALFPIASVSKLYTALVVHHLFDLARDITITQPMLAAYGTAGNLAVDEKLLPNELLYALLLESSNDAAEAFAQDFGYQDFIIQMNAFAREIGMEHTSFADPSGLSSENVSNAKDLFTLSQYLYRSEQDILEISRTAEKVLEEDGRHKGHTFVNIHPYVGKEGFLGGKTGRTSEAKESMITLWNYPTDEGIRPVAVIVLRSDFGERHSNTEKLLNLLSYKNI